MIIWRRVARTAAVTTALCLAVAAPAQAFTWGKLSVSHSGTLRGQGQGTFSAVGYNGAKLTASLSDKVKDDTRTYASAKGYGNNDYVGVDSGRRDDGGTDFVLMATKTGYAQGSTSGFKGKVRICQDVSLSPDWCSAYTALQNM